MAYVQSATFEIYFYRTHGGTPVSRDIPLHQLLQDWKEGEATWYKRLTSSNWNTNGVGINNIDAKSTAEDTATWYNEDPAWKIYDITNFNPGQQTSPLKLATALP